VVGAADRSPQYSTGTPASRRRFVDRHVPAIEYTSGPRWMATSKARALIFTVSVNGPIVYGFRT
jgi:hypothetical protein